MTSTSTDRRLGLSSGVAFKAPVRAATTAAITLSGEQTIDGIACVTDDRVLVKNQTDQTTNGVYVCDTGSWERDLDFDGSNDIRKGTLVLVNVGTVNAQTVWVVTSSDPITFESSNITFSQFNPSVLAGTTGTGLLVLQTGPTLVTPNIGAATGTSLALSGALSAAGGTFAGSLNLSSSLAGNVTFPAAQHASTDVNTLDDYEEGTFTPVVTVGGSTAILTSQYAVGTYTKEGNRCLYSLAVNFGSTVGAGSVVAIGGLPFVSATVTNMVGVGSIFGTGLLAIVGQLQATIPTSTDAIGLSFLSTGTASNLSSSNLTTSVFLRISGQYQTAS